MTLSENILDSKKLQIIPLGGVMEIGKNMYAYVYDEKILLVDAGLMFPKEEMLGVDIVIPDITYLEENRENVLGIVITHGHEDHIGALPYVLRQLNVPVWGTPLTIGFLKNKLEEHKLLDKVQLNVVNTGDVIELGDFKVEYVRVSHSIPDASGLIISTPVGHVVHTSDFKFDQSPVNGYVVNVSRLARIGEEGVLAFLCDTTNAEKPGYTQSESLVGEALDKIFASAPSRIIVAAFASNLHRIQQIFDIAAKYGRRVAVIGRSMVANCRIAEDLGYLKVPQGTRLLISELDDLELEDTVIVTTGSQGEPLAALSKMANGEHKNIKIGPGDTVIISASPIPGNENLVHRTINRLFKRGAEVVYEPYANVHVSGHGNQEDIKLMLNLLHPKFLIPIHGEERHFRRFQDLAESMGYPLEDVFILNIGDVLEISEDNAEINGKVHSGSVMVDGLGVGDVEDLVLRDRRHLSQDGVVILVVGIDVETKTLSSGPDLFSKGFVGEDWQDELIEDAKVVINARLNDFVKEETLDQFDEIAASCKKGLAKFIYERTHRRPMIVPIIMEV